MSGECECGSGMKRGSAGSIALTSRGELLRVQGIATGGFAGVNGVRYRSIPAPIDLPESIAAQLNDKPNLAVSTSRLAASAPITFANVIEVAQKVDTAIVEAWLVENGQGFEIDAKRLQQLADAKLAPSVIDLMVALSYPKIFSVNAASREGEFRPEESRAAETRVRENRRVGMGVEWDIFGNPY